MKKQIVITGVNGFVGGHLAKELFLHNIEVIGIGMDDKASPAAVDYLRSYVKADLSKQWPVRQPVDAIIHLAGLAAVGPSFDSPQKYLDLNSAMLTNMAEYYLGQSQKPRIVAVSSGAIYSSAQPMPLTENSALGFSSPYAVSKVLVENQCKYYVNRGLDCVIVRPFNHIGPGQGEGFLVPDVVNQLRKGSGLRVGNITTKRDYTDVRDIASAYRLLATSKKLNQDTYNACSGESTSGEEIVNLIKDAMSKESLETTIDSSRVRPTDPPEIYGSSAPLSRDTGWAPRFSLEMTIADIVKDLK